MTEPRAAAVRPVLDPEPMLRVEALSAWYGEARALHEVSLQVREGEVVTLVGRNGAGKSTLLRAVMGLHRQCQGRVELAGQDVSRWTPERRARAGLGWVPDDRGIYSTLTVEENLKLPPVVHASGWPLERIYESFPVLAERRAFPGTKLSGGEQQMLALARVLRTGARVLLLDEPTEGLAPVVVARIADLVRVAKDHGASVLLVEQNVRFAASVADRHYLLAQGRVVESLDTAEFREREGELLAYLGI